MKKILVLPVLALVGMVGNAAAVACQEGGKNAFCQYATGCFALSTEYSTVPKVCETEGTCSCEQILQGCFDDGAIYTGVNASALNEGNGYGEGVQCGSNGGTLARSSSCGTYCVYEAGGPCTPIKPDPTGSYGDPTTTCAEAEANCSNKFTESTCGGTSNPGNPGNPDPILQHHGMAAIAGLTLAPHSLGMQISTSKDAKLTMFDARGNTVYKADVVAGLNVVSMKDQKQGVYFAVVTSGSLKQSLKVIVK